MPKIGKGKYEYPSRDLDDCLKFLEKAHTQGKALVFTRETFAKDIGLSPTGGNFGLLVGSMSMFGLIETGMGDIRYTDIAKVILFGQPEEREQKKNEAVRNIKIFNEIFERFQENPTEGNIVHILREKAGEPIENEAEIAKKVRNSFKRNAQHFQSVGGENVYSPEIKSDGSIRGILKTSTIEVKIADELSLQTAKNLLLAFEKDIKNSMKEKEQPKKISSNSTEGGEED